MSELGIRTWEFLAGALALFLSSPEQGNKEMINCSLLQSSAFACVFPSVSHASMCSSEVSLSRLSTVLQNTMTGQFMSARGKEHNFCFQSEI